MILGLGAAERSRSRPCEARPEGLALTDEHQPYAGNGWEHGLKRPCSPATRRAGEGFGRGNPLPIGSNSPPTSSSRLLHALDPRHALSKEAPSYNALGSVCFGAQSLDNPMPLRTTPKSYRPRVSDRTMVANRATTTLVSFKKPGRHHDHRHEIAGNRNPKSRRYCARSGTINLKT